jgi:hypothetical protein
MCVCVCVMVCVCKMVSVCVYVCTFMGGHSVNCHTQSTTGLYNCVKRIETMCSQLLGIALHQTQATWRSSW